jgi:cation transport ATPase
MIEAVAGATAARTRYERLAEQISCWFLPSVAVVAATTLDFTPGTVMRGPASWQRWQSSSSLVPVL